MGGLEFVINLGDLQIIENSRSSPSRFTQGVLIGPMFKAGKIRNLGRIYWLGASFRPGSSPVSFLGAPIRELTNTIATFADLWGNSGQILVNQCLRARNCTTDLIALLDHYFLNKLSSDNSDGPVDLVLQAIVTNRGQVKIEDLIRETGLSRCQFARRFKQRVGLTPKQFSRLERMRYTLHRFFHEPYENLAELALECGYYDQAHFNREFRSFTGFSPSISKQQTSDLGQLLLAPFSARENTPESRGGNSYVS